MACVGEVGDGKEAVLTVLWESQTPIFLLVKMISCVLCQMCTCGGKGFYFSCGSANFSL